MVEKRRAADIAEELGGWSVTGVTALLDAVYWTESIDDELQWCIDCECLVETADLVDHLCRQHGDGDPPRGAGQP